MPRRKSARSSRLKPTIRYRLIGSPKDHLRNCARLSGSVSADLASLTPGRRSSLYTVAVSIGRLRKASDVRGPFAMLQSGVVISDLPGAGDLNWARANQASQAVKEAGQILIAVDGRLFQKDLMEQLEVSGRLPHRLFRDGEHLQIIVLGTSLDKGLPDPEDDDDARQIADLGLGPTHATKTDVFKATCDRWREAVRPEFASWLKSKANEFLPDLSDEDRIERVERIMANVEVIPTSAKDWRRFRRGKPMEYCRDSRDTGLPHLRAIINSLAEHQIRTTVGVLERRIDALREAVLGAIERSEAALGADIQSILDAVQQSHQSMNEVQERQAKIVEDLAFDRPG